MPAEPGYAEAYLGRSLRPWWGASPLWMVVRGLVQGAAFGVAVYVGRTLRTDGFDLGEEVVSASSLERLGLAVVVIGVVGLVLNAVRLVVAVADLFTVHTVEGVLLSCRERRRGDFLPEFVQEWIWSRGTDSGGHERYDRRRVRTLMEVDTGQGRRSWTVRRAGLVRDSSAGRPVRVRTSRLLGHVSRVEDASPP